MIRIKQIAAVTSKFICHRVAFIAVVVLLFAGSCLPPFSQLQGVRSQNEEFWLWTIDFSPTDNNKFTTGGTNGYIAIGSKQGYKEYIPVDGQVTELQWNSTSNAIGVAIQGGQKSFIKNYQDGASYLLDSIDNFGARALSWNPDGTKLALGDYSGNLTIHDAHGQLITLIKVNDKEITGLDWSPDGSKVVTVGDDIVLVDLKNETTKLIQDRQEQVLMLCVAYHPSGEYFGTGDYGDGENNILPLLQYWTQDGQFIRKIQEARGEYRSMEWSHDGKLLATASDRVRIFDTNGIMVNQGKEESTFLWGISWSRNDKVLAATDSKETIIMYDRRMNIISKNARNSELFRAEKSTPQIY